MISAGRQLRICAHPQERRRRNRRMHRSVYSELVLTKKEANSDRSALVVYNLRRVVKRDKQITIASELLCATVDLDASGVSEVSASVFGR